MKKIWVLTATHWAHSEDWSDWVDAQADLSLHWEHRSFYWFVMLRLKWFQWIPVGREVQLAALQTEINYVLLYLIMLFWNIWHVKIFFNVAKYLC